MGSSSSKNIEVNTSSANNQVGDNNEQKESRLGQAGRIISTAATHTKNAAVKVVKVVGAIPGAINKAAEKSQEAADATQRVATNVKTTIEQTKQATNNLTNVAKDTFDTAAAAGKSIAATATEAGKKITSRGEAKGGNLSGLIYGQENNSPSFYRPDNKRTILIVILLLLLVLVIIIMYYAYCCGVPESFKFKKLFKMI